MKLLVAALVAALASLAFAVEPGSQVTVTLPDGSVVNGVVVSTAPGGATTSAPAPTVPALPPMGFNTPPPTTQDQPLGATTPPQTATFIGVPVVPVQPLTREQKQDFLRQQAAEREARKHEVTTPLSDWQFNLQQALDRQAHGLPFNPPASPR